MNRFWKYLLAALAAVAAVRLLAHRKDADDTAEACRVYDDLE